MSSTEVVAAVRQGSRWLHNAPSGKEFAEWFGENVPIHEGLSAADYINGIVLIPNKERAKETRLVKGEMAIVEVEQLVFNPYPQVETRVRYFWDWCRVNGYLGEITILPPARQAATLPVGAFAMHVTAAGKESTFLGAQARVRAYERDLRTGDKGRDVMLPSIATKMVDIAGRYGPDMNAPMRAETGAIGRALGFAGMLVIPGSGVSTAEDMQEYTSQAASAPSLPGAVKETLETAPQLTEPAAEPQAPEDPATALRNEVSVMLAQLAEQHEEIYKQVQAWAVQREIDLDNPPANRVRALHRQLTSKLSAKS